MKLAKGEGLHEDSQKGVYRRKLRAYKRSRGLKSSALEKIHRFTHKRMKGKHLSYHQRACSPGDERECSWWGKTGKKKYRHFKEIILKGRKSTAQKF